MSAKNFASYGDLETLLTSYSNEIKKAILNVAPKFNSASSYTVGQYVTYNGELYKCTNNHSGAWNASHFSKTDVNTAKTSKEDIAEKFYNGMNAYFNKLVYKDNELYRYTKDVTNSAVWSDQDFHHVVLGDFISAWALLFNGADFWDDSDAGLILSWVSMGFTGGESQRCTAGLFRNVFGCGEGNYILAANDDALVNGIAFTSSGIYEIHFDSDACSLNAAPANPDEYLAAHCTITLLGSSGGGTKYYKHIITFRLKTPLEYYTDQPTSDYWKGTPGPDGLYITGMKRSNPNSQWVEMTNSDTPGMTSEYNSDVSEHRIDFTLGFISPVSNALTFDSAKSFHTSGKLIYLPLRPDTDTDQGNMTSASFNGSGLVLHRDFLPNGDSTILSGGWDGEKYYYLRPWMIADWKDAVSEWKV